MRLLDLLRVSLRTPALGLPGLVIPLGRLEQLRSRIQIVAGRFMSLPLKGLRNDFNSLTPRNMRQMFPMGVDYLHHCSPAVFRAFMETNGLSEA